MGVLNTLVDLTLFTLLHARLGVVAANLVSTSAGMTCSFVLNGRFTFGRTRLTLAQAARFTASTGLVLWVVQPLLILAAAPTLGILPAKLGANGACVLLTYAACRYVVWRPDAVTHRPHAPHASPWP
ncbi:MAG: GtrA family protein [Nocardioides sp.]